MNPAAGNLVPGTEVPRHYRGIWRRSLLETAGVRDTSTTVYWLQAASWHADIRIPAARPDFTGVASLADCNATHLAWLATQQGFAGMTAVRKHDRGEICTWRRVIDYQPAQAGPDEGWMQFEPARLVETGVHAHYLEHWHRVPLTSGDITVLQTFDSADPAGTNEMLFLAGQYVMHLRWPGAPGWPGPMLDLEISFGERTAQGYSIVHSTMPWLEGRERTVQLTGLHGSSAGLSCDGCPRGWKILEFPASEAAAWFIAPC